MRGGGGEISPTLAIPGEGISSMNYERRIFQAELRAVAQDSSIVLRGYAAVFNSLSQVIYGFREMIAPGAFAASIDDDIRALWNHDTNYVLGRTKSKTLSLAEDERGLAVEIHPPQTSLVESFVESIRRGDVDQMSFGFNVLDETWDQLEDGTVVRTLLKVKLFEVSPVAFPAYTATEVGVRGEQPSLYTPEIPAHLRRATQVPTDTQAALLRAQEERARRLALGI